MPDSKTSPTERKQDRPTMHKRVEQKEDGRVLIYYTFDESAKKDESEQTNSGAKS